MKAGTKGRVHRGKGDGAGWAQGRVHGGKSVKGGGRVKGRRREERISEWSRVRKAEGLRVQKKERVKVGQRREGPGWAK